MDADERASRGYDAVKAGTADFGANASFEGDPEGVLTDAVDAVANVLHYLFRASAEESLDAREAVALGALGRAAEHFANELRGAG